jgi:hypothetical protein
VSDLVTLRLTSDEAEIILDALESDLEGYEDSARDARANRAKADVETFEEAANRIRLVITKVQSALEI